MYCGCGIPFSYHLFMSVIAYITLIVALIMLFIPFLTQILSWQHDNFQGEVIERCAFSDGYGGTLYPTEFLPHSLSPSLEFFVFPIYLSHFSSEWTEIWHDDSLNGID